MKQIHFPACGLGFWYLLGVFVRYRRHLDNYIISGASAGALICALSLTTETDLYNKIMAFASAYKPTSNLHETYVCTLDHILQMVKDDKRTRRRLRNIRIQVTQIYPSVSRVFITPRNLAELREACIASAYIPLVSNYNNKLYYTIDNSHFVDGGFMEYFYTTTNAVYVPRKHMGLRIPTQNECRLRYNDGKKNLL